MARGSRVEINPKLRRLLQRAPEEITAENKKVIAEEAAGLAADMASNLVAIGGVRTGELLDSVDFRIGAKGLSATVGPGAKMGKERRGLVQAVARWLEFGTAPHALGQGDTRANKAQRKKERFTLGAAQHPGTPARPWLIPAWIARREPMRRRLREATRKALAKLAR